MIFYMPTIALAITVSYTVLKSSGINIMKGISSRSVSGEPSDLLLHFGSSAFANRNVSIQFYVASAASLLILGLYSHLPCRHVARWERE
jgi:NHS family xanthosine MFS transporter